MKMSKGFDSEKYICILGLGYVGLPLCIALSKKYKCIGFDIKKSRVRELQKGIDKSLESDLKQANTDNLKFTSSLSKLKKCNIFIVAVPTPVDKFNNPDLKSLKNASLAVAKLIKRGDLVIYESTVFPGATEEVCLPILERGSNLKLNKDFYIGYSPERVNPGDKKHSLDKITKVISGSNKKAIQILKEIYGHVTRNNLFIAKSIRVAEAAKVIENTQRDLNIALVNELTVLFDALGIDVYDVLRVASTKWNFLNFEPGLVGGHCIGVDPYYLTYKAKKIGYRPKLILAGREMNDSMPDYISKKIVTQLRQRKKKINESKVLILGITFKENCTDTRNSKSIELYRKLIKVGAKVKVFDPWVKDFSTEDLFGVRTTKVLGKEKYDAIVLSVKHDVFSKLNKTYFNKILKENSFIFDVKSCLSFKEDVITL